jgi:hypothetical protein
MQMNCFTDSVCPESLLILLFNVRMTLLAKLFFRFLFRINSLFVFVLPTKNYAFGPYFDYYLDLFCLGPDYYHH